MKRYLFLLIVLCIVSNVQGAHFSYYAGGFRAYYNVYAENLPYYDGPRILTQDGTNSASVAESAGVYPQPYGEAFNKIGSTTSNNSIFISSYSIAKGAADYSYCYARGKGFGRTQNSQTKGIFYKIMPDANEQNGDDVMVYYNDIVNISISDGTTYLKIGGPGTMDHIAITRGQLPPVTTEPVREKEVLRFPNVEASNIAITDLFSGIHAFPAKIGDVIGIFAENSTAVEGYGPLFGWIYSTFTMVLTVRPVLLGDLDYDDDVDFYDLAKLANNWLVDIGQEPVLDTTPPEPNPMQWASGGEPKEIVCSPYYCATMTAETATDPSGGIQYYFDCPDESGFDSDWQGSPTYTVTIGGSGFNYRFRVKARDIYGNETTYSPALPMNP